MYLVTLLSISFKEIGNSFNGYQYLSLEYNFFKKRQYSFLYSIGYLVNIIVMVVYSARWLLQIFSPSMWLFSSFYWQCFSQSRIFLILMKSDLSILLFIDHVFGVIFRKSLSNPESFRFSLMLLCKSFYSFAGVHIQAVHIHDLESLPCP